MTEATPGTVVSGRGSVVEVRFAGPLPQSIWGCAWAKPGASLSKCWRKGMNDTRA